MTTELTYLILFIVFCFVQSMFLHGIRIASKGESQVLPNGKMQHRGMLLYFVTRYMNRHHPVKIFYSGDELKSLISSYASRHMGLFPDVMQYTVNRENVVFHTAEAADIVWRMMLKLSGEGVYAQKNSKVFSFYKEYDKYVFPKWFRYPAWTCIKCMPSFWSLVTYWTPLWLYFGFSDWWMLGVWPVNIAVVSFINTYLAGKYQW